MSYVIPNTNNMLLILLTFLNDNFLTGIHRFNVIPYKILYNNYYTFKKIHSLYYNISFDFKDDNLLKYIKNHFKTHCTQ